MSCLLPVTIDYQRLMLQFQANSKVHPSKLTQILEAKWREFQESNPANKKDMKDENGSDISEPITGELWDFFYAARLT